LRARISYNAISIYRCGTAEWQSVSPPFHRLIRRNALDALYFQSRLTNDGFWYNLRKSQRQQEFDNMSSFDWQAEVIKAILNVIVAVVTLGLGWFIGHRLTVYWAIRQKQRELELSALNDFYNLYGEFFAIWKLWAYCNAPDKSIKLPDTTRWSLMERACIAEGKLEAIFVKLSSERTLRDYDVDLLHDMVLRELTERTLVVQNARQWRCWEG
jgi:hypothetical protein